MAIFSSSFGQELRNFMGRQRIISPEIGEETVTFRINAPEAKLVRLYGSWMSDRNSSVNMMKDSNNVWTVSIPLPEPELYTFNFIVDGLSVNDANNVLCKEKGHVI